MKMLFFDTKSYDKEFFEEKQKAYPEIQIEYREEELTPDTAGEAKGYDAVDVSIKTAEGARIAKLFSVC